MSIKFQMPMKRSLESSRFLTSKYSSISFISVSLSDYAFLLFNLRSFYLILLGSIKLILRSTDPLNTGLILFTSCRYAFANSVLSFMSCLKSLVSILMKLRSLSSFSRTLRIVLRSTCFCYESMTSMISWISFSPDTP